MSNLIKLEFVALDIFGKNDLSWIFDVEICMTSMNLGETIKEGQEITWTTIKRRKGDFRRTTRNYLECIHIISF